MATWCSPAEQSCLCLSHRCALRISCWRSMPRPCDLMCRKHGIFLRSRGPALSVLFDVRLLHEKTEGWPAALRIVASTSIQLRQDFAQYVRNLSGAQRPIGAYLDELLAGLPHDMVQFMLRTAILDRLCAPLCEAVTGASSSQGLLGSIEKRQLLLAPLDQEGKW